jgi:uncharacterized protein
MLTLLLPISVSISLLQIALHSAHIDWALFRRILVYTLPFVVICVAAITKAKINIGFVVGPFLLFVALEDFSARIGTMVALVRHFARLATRTEMATSGLRLGAKPTNQV